jgi:hypothetical protein
MKGIFSFLAFLIAAGFLVFTIFGIPLLAIWVACIYIGSAGRAEQAEKKIASTLMAEEKVIAQGVQYRVFAFFNRRAFVAITNSRIIKISRGLLGGFKMLDIQWKDLRDVQLEENVLSDLCGSNLIFKHANPNVPLLGVDGVKSDIASSMYSKAQFEEQAWEEKRRVRNMEEQRARAGGVVVNTGHDAVATPTQTTAPVSESNRIFAEIEKAKQLLDMGAISDSEFQEMKAKILGKS